MRPLYGYQKERNINSNILMKTEEQQPDDIKEENKNGDDGDHELAKGNQPNVQKKPDDERVKTVTPDNDSGDPGPPVEERKS